MNDYRKPYRIENGVLSLAREVDEDQVHLLFEIGRKTGRWSHVQQHMGRVRRFGRADRLVPLERLGELLAQGLRTSEIAKTFGVSDSAVSHAKRTLALMGEIQRVQSQERAIEKLKRKNRRFRAPKRQCMG
jgi:hypothetical protein